MKVVEDPIRVGDKFLSPSGKVFEVIADQRFGRIEIFCKKRALFMLTTKKDIRQWHRLNEVAA